MDNETKILKAFDRLAKAKDNCARRAMEEVLKRAMEWALNTHDEKHQQHIQLGDNYGWAVVHDAEIVAMDVKAPSGKDGVAEKQLRKIVRSSRKDGWYGILMAGMGDKTTYYSVDYETAILNSTENFVRDNFSNFFVNKIL